jgi:hypothetical protein
MRVTRPVLVLSVFAFAFVSSAAQQSPGVSSPQAIQLLQRALQALTKGAPLQDVTLTGTARRIAGSDDETGQATLTATPTGSRMDLNLPSGKRTEISSTAASQPAGTWSDPDGVTHKVAYHNLFTEQAWFFPAFAIGRGVSASTHLATYIGQETKDSQTVEHFTITQQSQGPNEVRSLVDRLSQTNLYLDSTTLLPAAMTFNIHPDNNALLDIPIEIHFSDYRAVNGVEVPFHVQKFLNNGLVLDLQFQNAALNSGHPDPVADDIGTRELRASLRPAARSAQ